MVQLILNENNQPIGWKIEPKTKDEQLIAATIRDLQFFGFDAGIPKENTNIEYDGLTLIDESKGKTLGNIKSLSWVQTKYQKH